MNRKTELEKITKLLDAGQIENGILLLDNLLSVYAQTGQINTMIETLEYISKEYPNIEALKLRMQEVNHRLGRNPRSFQ